VVLLPSSQLWLQYFFSWFTVQRQEGWAHFLISGVFMQELVARRAPYVPSGLDQEKRGIRTYRWEDFLSHTMRLFTSHRSKGKGSIALLLQDGPGRLRARWP
jgi:hypothetical protein